MVTVGNANLLELAAGSSSVAMDVQQKHIAEVPRLNVDVYRARSRPAKIIKGTKKVGLWPEDAASTAGLGAVPHLTPLPAGNFVEPKDPHGDAAGQGQ